MLSSCNRFNPFPFISLNNLNLSENSKYKEPSDKKRKREEYCKCRKNRLWLSILVLNVAPFGYFLFVFFIVFKIFESLFGAENYLMSLIAMFFALSVFAWYRLYRGSLIYWKDCFFCDVWEMDENKK